MTEEEFRQAREPRLDPQLAFPHWMRELIGAPAGTTLRVLDVGSRPLSTLGVIWPGRTVELTTCDPLADEYNILLTACGLADRAQVQKANGEALDSVFSANSFDFVHSANALDHAYDPLRCVQNMLTVCKPGGHVAFISVENEGERQNYEGLHKWNFSVEDGAHLRLWNRERNLMQREHLLDVGEFVVERVDHGNGLPVFLASMKKTV
jgi:SAM-dependent methyltransferase